MKTSVIETHRKILWAIDPSQSPSETSFVIRELETWAKRLSASVQPVTMTSLWMTNLTSSFNPAQRAIFQEFADRGLERFVAKSNAKGFLAPINLFSRSFSNQRLAKELSEYAKTSGASLIVATSRSKKTSLPPKIGSFAEALAASSQVPVLLVNGKSPSTKKDSTLFPTDFSRPSESTLNSLLPLLKLARTELVLFNEVERPWFVESTAYLGAPPIDLTGILEDVKTGRQKAAKELEALAKSAQVPSRAIIQIQDRSRGFDIADTAKRSRSTLIAALRPKRSSGLGRNFRDLIAEAPCPILILSPSTSPLTEIKSTSKKPNRSFRENQGFRARNKNRPDSQIQKPSELGLQELNNSDEG